LERTYILTYDTITNSGESNITVPFVAGKEYWFHVKAFSFTYQTYSLPSNPTNVVFSTNI
jgi:hypothetical protein